KHGHREIRDNLPPLRNSTHPAHRPVTNTGNGLGYPLWAQQVDGVFKATWNAMVVFRGDKDVAIQGIDFIRPSLYLGVSVRFICDHGMYRAGQQRHVIICQIDKFVLNATVALRCYLEHKVSYRNSISFIPDGTINNSDFHTDTLLVFRSFHHRILPAPSRSHARVSI